MQLMKSSTSSRIVASRRPVLKVRAESPIAPPPSPAAHAPAPTSSSEGVVMMGGKTMSEAEYKAMEKAAPISALWNPSTSGDLPSFDKVMGFSGSPEVINGRLAMMGFIAAVGAELSSGDSVLRQVSEEPTGIVSLFILIIAGSLVPAFLNTKPEAFGPLTPAAELTNGRGAMIGFAAMLLIEGNLHHALF